MSPSSVVAARAGHVQEVVSPGGLRAYLIHEPSLPIISLVAHIRGGAALDPPGQAGLANMMACLLDEGAGELDSQAFRQALEDDAIRLEVEAHRDSLSVELRTLTANSAQAFALLRLALTAPRFDEEPVERVRGQLTASLRRRSTDPEHVASRSWREEAFAGHPYARPVQGSLDSIAGIDVASLRACAASRLNRDRLSIGVSGDIDPATLARVLDEVFGGLPAGIASPELAAVQPAAGRVRVVPMAIPQSVVRFGHAGIPRHDPDHYAAHVANYILGGGGFSSRLLEEIREKRGLAYSVYSYLEDSELAPLWIGGLATRNEQVALSLELLRAELAKMAAGEVDETELANARTYLTGSFPLRLTSNDAVAKTLGGMMLWDLGIDFLDRRNGYIEAVTLGDVRRVARRLFDQPLLVTIVGDPKGIDPSS